MNRPRIMRFALQRANETGAKWKQMFRPGFNDMVNESFKVGIEGLELLTAWCSGTGVAFMKRFYDVVALLIFRPWVWRLSELCRHVRMQLK